MQQHGMLPLTNTPPAPAFATDQNRQQGSGSVYQSAEGALNRSQLSNTAAEQIRGGNSMCHLDGGMPTFQPERPQISPQQQIPTTMRNFMDPMNLGGSWPGHQSRPGLNSNAGLMPGLLMPSHQGQKQFPPGPMQMYANNPYQMRGMAECAPYSYPPQMQGMGGSMYPMHHVHQPMYAQQMPGAYPEGSDPRYDANPELRATKKPRLVWTPELHARFERAIKDLGPDRSNPKSIMVEMNVEGLERANVASHLQKFRLMQKRDAGRASRAAGASPEDNLATPPSQATPRSASTGGTTTTSGQNKAAEPSKGDGNCVAKPDAGEDKSNEEVIKEGSEAVKTTTMGGIEMPNGKAVELAHSGGLKSLVPIGDALFKEQARAYLCNSWFRLHGRCLRPGY
eukprot:gene10841-16962_t